MRSILNAFREKNLKYFFTGFFSGVVLVFFIGLSNYFVQVHPAQMHHGTYAGSDFVILGVLYACAVIASILHFGRSVALGKINRSKLFCMGFLFTLPVLVFALWYSDRLVQMI